MEVDMAAVVVVVATVVAVATTAEGTIGVKQHDIKALGQSQQGDMVYNWALVS